MAEQKNYQRVSAIVPVYNEAERVGAVLTALTQCDFLAEIIVVDDGSTDHTASVVKNFPVQYVRLLENGGKGRAMDRGVAEAKSPVLFFCDGDITGITPEIIWEIVSSVASGEVEMFVCMQNRKSYYLRFLLAFIPLVGGVRALTKELWQKLPAFYKQGFRIETGLNFYAKYYGRGFRFKVFLAVGHVIKEKKYGRWHGLRSRARMFADYFSALIKMQFTEIPRNIINRRLFFVSFFSWLGGLAFGLFLLVAAYTGPRQFLARLFAEKLATDPETPVLHFFLHWAGVVSVDIIITVAFGVVLLNVFLVMVNIKKFLLMMNVGHEKWKASWQSPAGIHPSGIGGEKKA